MVFDGPESEKRGNVAILMTVHESGQSVPGDSKCVSVVA
jgi:hypothetical protein